MSRAKEFSISAFVHGVTAVFHHYGFAGEALDIGQCFRQHSRNLAGVFRCSHTNLVARPGAGSRHLRAAHLPGERNAIVDFAQLAGEQRLEFVDVRLSLRLKPQGEAAFGVGGAHYAPAVGVFHTHAIEGDELGVAKIPSSIRRCTIEIFLLRQPLRGIQALMAAAGTRQIFHPGSAPAGS